MKRPLLVNAHELLRRPGSERRIEMEVPVADVGLDDPRLPSDSTVRVDLVCSSLNDGIVVDGRVSAEFRGDCRRCLRPLSARVESPVHELYQETLTDPDAFPIDNDQIDLVAVVRETVLIDLPDTPLCRSECRGLCATCGADLNEIACGCVREEIDPRWSALDGILDQLPDQ